MDEDDTEWPPPTSYYQTPLDVEMEDPPILELPLEDDNIDYSHLPHLREWSSSSYIPDQDLHLELGIVGDLSSNLPHHLIPEELHLEDDTIINPSFSNPLGRALNNFPSLSSHSNLSMFSGSTRSGGSSTGRAHRRYYRTPMTSRPASVALDAQPDNSHQISTQLPSIPPVSNSTRDMLFESLGQRLQSVGANLQTGHSLPQSQLLDLRSDLQELMSHVENLIRQTTTTESLEQPTPEVGASVASSASNTSQEHYRCQLCGYTNDKNRHGFKRHLMDQHYPSYEYHCPEIGCGRIYRRQGILIEHFRHVHSRLLRKEELERATIPQKCPPLCAMCPTVVQGWNEFYQCVMKHCLVLPGDSESGNDLGDGKPKPQQVPSLQKDKSRAPTEAYTRQDTQMRDPWTMEPIYELPANEDPGLWYRSPQNSGNGQKGMQFASIDEEISSPGQKIKMPTALSSDNAHLGLARTSFVLLGKDKVSQQSPRPSLNPIDSNTSKSSQQSDDEESHSMETSITRPDQEEDFDLDTGIADSEDMEHILHPSAYYRKLDLLEQKTAEICDIKSPKLQENPLHECRDAMQRNRGALQNLMDAGFCDSSFSILVRDQSRSNVANAVRISIHDIDDALNRMSPLAIAAGISQFTSIFEWPMLHDLFGDPSSDSNWDQLEYLQFLTNALSVGLVAFSGSHVCRFDENLWGEELSEINVGQGHSFALRDLACLKEFVGGPAWILETDRDVSQMEGLKVSLTVKDLQELWGPVWLMGGGEDEGVFIRTETGYIIPLPRQEQTDQSLVEIECHWSSSYAGYETANPILLHSLSRILIGTGPSTMTGLSINEECQAQINYLQARILPRLQPCGAHKAYNTLVGWDFTMQATMGNSVQAGGTIKVKRNPARTWKTSIIESCKYGKPHLRSLLSSNIGLEVSACTGNARRVTLWDALRLSHTPARRHPGIAPQQESHSCPHRIADPKCIQSCWTRLFSTDDIDTPVNIPPEGHANRIEYLRRIILNSIIALEDTGVDYEGDLQAYWPFTGSPRTHRIEISPSSSSSGETNNWIRVIKEARDVATFAVVSQSCMEVHHGHVRTCTMPCQVAHLNRPKTTLYTRILLNGNEGNKLGPNEHFVLGEAALTVKRIVPNKNMIIAAAGGSAVRNEWTRLVRLGRRKEFQEDLDCDLSTGHFFSLLVQ